MLIKHIINSRFKQWVAASGKPPNITPRHGVCIHVDAASLESVLAGPKPPDLDLDRCDLRQSDRHVLGSSGPRDI